MCVGDLMIFDWKQQIKKEDDLPTAVKSNFKNIILQPPQFIINLLTFSIHVSIYLSVCLSIYEAVTGQRKDMDAEIKAHIPGIDQLISEYATVSSVHGHALLCRCH